MSSDTCTRVLAALLELNGRQVQFEAHVDPDTFSAVRRAFLIIGELGMAETEHPDVQSGDYLLVKVGDARVFIDLRDIELQV
jgi:hypothetical protein